MSYRVETALSKRAGCQSTECKANGVKIDKDDLRLGIWVDYGERAGWTWRHWGCVTGKVLQGLRDLVSDPDSPGSYRWDMLDGYESGDKNSLDRNPALQEKVRRCITQGFIDPEDFNGDPEMNVLGAVGLRTKESKKKMRDEKKASARNEEIDDLKTQIAALTAEKAASGGNSDLDARIASAQANLDKHLSANTPAAKKRVKDEGDAEEGTPAKKKRATKKKAEAEDYEEEDVKPAKPVPKSRAKKVKKEEDKSEDDAEETKPTPAKNSRAKKAIKKEQDNDEEDAQESKPAPAKKSRAKKVVKKEEEDDNEGAEESKPAPAKKTRAKKAVKKEEDTEMSGTVDDHTGIKNEEDLQLATQPTIKKRGVAKTKPTKAEVDEDDYAVENLEVEHSAKAAPKKRAPRERKGVKVETAEDGNVIDDIEPKPKPAAKKGRKKAVKEESVEEESSKDEPVTEASNSGITEGSSILSDLPDLLEDIKDEPVESVSLAPEAEIASTSATAAKSKSLVVPAKNRRTRSRTASNKV